MNDAQALFAQMYNQANPQGGVAGAGPQPGAGAGPQNNGGSNNNGGKDDNVVDGDYREV